MKCVTVKQFTGSNGCCLFLQYVSLSVKSGVSLLPGHQFLAFVLFHKEVELSSCNF